MAIKDNALLPDSLVEFESTRTKLVDVKMQVKAKDSEVNAGMLDLLIFTYIYVEKLRKDREQAIDKKGLLLCRED
ncbi:hypothetical protein PAXRUDRAFT_827202 [Paxillus rubicundulus Ve08.2h10]|uniref:Uncharacterized protein n=1 Tax=Paxillus rubicundulus Ve08.2h10 TaxID=930991 RepID=A0A0D0E8U5_9AGAM|nr:hypothetical protein PAXRUDRAFT_827202 [Paxillus rubicundulus Ve08.2h10]